MIEKFSKNLKDFNPINGYRLDCYRSALLPIFDYYHIDFYPLLLAKAGYFTYKEHLNFNFLTVFKYNDIFSKVGIVDFRHPVTNDDIIDKICAQINEDKAVIAFIDSFEYHRFPAIYHKVHLRHGLPIYGYDYNECFFNIIDSQYIEDFSRIHATISFSDFKKAHNSMLEYYKLDNFIEILYKSENFPPMQIQDWIDDYHNFYVQNKNCYIENEIALGKTALFLQKNYANQETMKKEISYIYMAFNNVINTRHLEYSIFAKLFPCSPILQCLENLIEKYNYVRAIMYKMSYTQIYREKSIEKCATFVDQIRKLEKEYYQFICNDIVSENIKLTQT